MKNLKLTKIIATTLVLGLIITLPVHAATNRKFYDVNNNIISGEYSYEGYFIQPNGKYLINTWIRDYSFLNDGIVLRNAWYYIGSNGKTVVGWQRINWKWYYFSENNDSDGLGIMLANTTTPDGYYVGPDGAWIDSTITLNEAEKIAFNKVKAIYYPNISIKLIIMNDPYEIVIEGREGYAITIGESHPDHDVSTNHVFVDKHTGQVFDAFDYIFDIGDKKLKELN